MVSDNVCGSEKGNWELLQDLRALRILTTAERERERERERDVERDRERERERE